MPAAALPPPGGTSGALPAALARVAPRAAACAGLLEAGVTPATAGELAFELRALGAVAGELAAAAEEEGAVEEDEGDASANSLAAVWVDVALMPLVQTAQGVASRAIRSARVAEAAAAALLSIARRPGPRGQVQLARLLQALLALAAARDEAGGSEETRRDAVRGVAALAERLQEATEAEAPASASLAGAANAPGLGHALSTLVGVAAAEAGAGLRGSRVLLAEALRAMRLLLRCVGGADDLAFFLPGVASGVSKVLMRAAGGGASGGGHTAAVAGAAASGEGIAEGVNALAELFAIVMDDEANAAALTEQAANSAAATANSSADGNGVAEQFRGLAVAASSEAKVKGAAAAHTAGASTARNEGQGGVSHHGPPEALRVRRDAAWLSATAARLAPYLDASLAPLCTHARARVRRCVAACCARLLGGCARSLGGSAEVPLRCLLCLALDDDRQAARTARRALLAVVAAHPRWRRAVERSIPEGFTALRQALEGRASAGSVVARARQLSVALQVARARGLHRACLATRAGVRDTVATLMAVFRVRVNARLVAEERPSGAVVALPGASRLGGGQAAGASEAESAASALPRMPPALAHDMGGGVYEAVAHAVRCVGHVLAEPEGGGGNADAPQARALRALCAEVVATQRSAAEGLARAASGSPLQDVGEGVAASLCRERAATAAVVLAEVCYGASPACAGAFWADSNGHGSGDDAAMAGKGPNGEAASRASERSDTFPPRSVLSAAADGLGEMLAPALWRIGALRGVERTCALVSQQALLESMGVLARACGPHFTSSARLLAAALHPMLTAYGSDNTNACVSGSAHAALLACCGAVGVPSLSALVLANADYVVDALCRGMRHVELHPDAPQLFRAVMVRAGRGTARKVLPLVAEPMRGVVSAMGHTQRQKATAHLEAFADIVAHISEAVGAEVVELRRGAEAASNDARAAQRRDGAAADEVAAAVGAAAGALAGDSDDSDDEEVFSPNRDARAREPSADADALRVAGASPERRARLVVALRLLAAVLDAALPLAQEAPRGERTQRRGLRAAGAALRALRDADAAAIAELEVDHALHALRLADEPPEERYDALMAGDASELPRLLPSVVRAWPAALACLRSPRVPVVLAALELMGDACAAGGEFMARRFGGEGAAALSQLLQHGARPAAAPPGVRSRYLTDEAAVSAALVTGVGVRADEARAPQALAAVRACALACVAVAGGAGALPAEAAVNICRQALPCLALAEAEAAVAALYAADPDGVWLELFKASGCAHSEALRCVQPEACPSLREIAGGPPAAAGAAARSREPPCAPALAARALVRLGAAGGCCAAALRAVAERTGPNKVTKPPPS